MIRVMVMIQTFGGSITRVAGEFGGSGALEYAERHRAYWAAQPDTLLTWLD